MQLFINECSLHGQFYSRDQLTDALKVFYSLFAFFNKHKIESGVYKSTDLFLNYKALKDELFVKSFNALQDKSLSRALKNVLFNKQNVRDWNTERQHSIEDLFEFNDENITNTSMAELAERKLSHDSLISALINFPQSKFENLKAAKIKKNKTQNVTLNCVENKNHLEKWLNRHLVLNLYEFSSRIPPADNQTVLKNSNRFIEASIPLQGGRKVYREVGTGYYWYVDNLHFGKASHIEVFGKNGKHIGEADIEGTINEKKADVNKILRV